MDNLIRVVYVIITYSSTYQVPLQFGFHNMLSQNHSYYSVFKKSLENNIVVHSVEFEWREDVLPGIFFWGKSDSIVIAAYNAMMDTGVEIELRARFQNEICAPYWAPVDVVTSTVGGFDMARMRNYEYNQQFLQYLVLFLERYRPGGILASEMGWSNSWGVSHYDIFGELDRMWYMINDYGDKNSVENMHLDEFGVLYNSYRNTLRSIDPNVRIPISTLSTPFSENEDDENAPFLYSEDEYIEFFNTVRLYTEEDVSYGPMDEFDWHTFILANDPLKPGIYSSTPEWKLKSFSSRATLIADMLSDVQEVPISTLEGAATCYWKCMRDHGVELNHRNHIVFQLSSLAEISHGGRTRVLTFDSTIDDGVTADVFPEYSSYEAWWDDAVQPEDSLFCAYGRMATLLTGKYCTNRSVYTSTTTDNKIVVFTYTDPVTQMNTYMLRAINDQYTTYPLPVQTDEVTIYNMLDTPCYGVSENGIIILSNVNWNITWVQENEQPIVMSEGESPVLSISRNPVSSTVTFCVESVGSTQGRVEIEIYDMVGRLVDRVEMQETGGMHMYEYRCNAIPNGVYHALVRNSSSPPVKFVVLNR